MIKKLTENAENRLIPGILGLLGLVVRLFRLDHKSLFIDELMEVFVASKDIPGMMDGIAVHLSPPLDYMLLRIPLFFGNSDYLLRLNAVIFGSAAVVIFYLLVKELFNFEIGLISALLLIFSKYHIYYSQEVRMYSLFLLLTVSSYYIFWLYLNKTNRQHSWLLVFVNTALLYTHYYGILVIAVQMLWVAGSFMLKIGRDRIINILQKAAKTGSPYLWTGLLFLPWLKVLRIQLDQSFYGGVPFYSNTQNLYNNFLTIIARMSWQTIYDQIVTKRFGNLFGFPWPTYLLSPFELIFFGLFFLGVVYSILRTTSSRRQIGFLLLWLVVPILFVILINGNTNPRYYIFLLPPYLIFIALGLSGLWKGVTGLLGKKPGRIVYGFAMVPLVMVIMLSLYDYYFRLEKENWREVGAFLEQNTNKEDFILVLGGHAAYLEHYYHGDALVVDADYMHSETPYVNDFDELRDFILKEECSWVFVTHHSNLIFDNDSNNKEDTRAVQALLLENMDYVEEVYQLQDFDFAGLYQSAYCDPY